jgi:hypothetical protein
MPYNLKQKVLNYLTFFVSVFIFAVLSQFILIFNQILWFMARRRMRRRARTIVRNIYRPIYRRIRRRGNYNSRPKNKKGFMTWIWVAIVGFAGFFFSPQIKKLFSK